MFVAGASLLGAAAIVLAVVVPAARVVVAPAGSAVGPIEYDLRAGPAGEPRNTVTRPSAL